MLLANPLWQIDVGSKWFPEQRICAVVPNLDVAVLVVPGRLRPNR